MHPDPSDFEYFSDAVCMAVADCLPREVVFSALEMSDSAEQFNWAIWASCYLQGMLDAG